jgi:ABC-type sugar transport system permease subunit
VGAGVAVRGRRPRKRSLKRSVTVLLFMAPWIIGFVALILYPMISSLYF